MPRSAISDVYWLFLEDETRRLTPSTILILMFPPYMALDRLRQHSGIAAGGADNAARASGNGRFPMSPIWRRPPS